MKIRKTILTILIFDLAIISFAQTYKGNVKDTKGEPMPFANVALYMLPDSTFVDGTTTNESGYFSLKGKNNGKGYLEVSFIGYETKRVLAQDNIGVITLKEVTNELGEVLVKGRRKAVKQEATGFKVDVGSYVNTTGKSALDVLKVLPGIIQNDESLSVMGRHATIFVNGKKLQLSGKAKESYLNSLQGRDIKSIKIITNPSSRYDADLTGGIIDIKLNKNQSSEGINGNIRLGAGIKKTGMIYTPSLSLNYRKNKLNIYGNYGYYQGKYEKDIELLQKLKDSKQNNNNYELSKPKDKSNSFTFGADYMATEKHTVGVLVKAGNYTSDFDSDIKTLISSFSTAAHIDSTIVSNLRKDKEHKYLTANLNHQWKTDTIGGVLNTDFTFSYIENENKHNMVSSHFNDSPKLEALDKTGSRQNIKQDNKIWTMRMYYQKPLKQNITLETGLNYSFVNRSVLQDYTNKKSGIWLLDEMQKANTAYKESLLAGYVEVAKKWGAWSTSAGVRGEYTHYKGKEVNSNDFSDSYFDLFPSASISHKFQNKSNASLSYSRKITRPSLSFLNPFRFYNGYSVYQVGNPNLKPYYSNALELKYNMPRGTFISLRYSWYKDDIVQEATRNAVTNEIVYTYQNFGKSNFTTLSVFVPIQLSNWWKLRLNALGRYSYYESHFMGGAYSNDDILGQVVLYNQFNISKDLSADLQMQYTSKRNHYETKIEPRSTMQASITQSFWNKKAAFTISVVDPFRWNDFNSSLKYNDLDLQIYEESDRTMIKLSFSYNFGSNRIKGKRRRNTGAETIENRAK